jgi:hypothetical protein
MPYIAYWTTSIALFPIRLIGYLYFPMATKFIDDAGKMGQLGWQPGAEAGPGQIGCRAAGPGGWPGRRLARAAARAGLAGWPGLGPGWLAGWLVTSSYFPMASKFGDDALPLWFINCRILGVGQDMPGRAEQIGLVQ